MAVREYDGLDDNLITSIGALSGMTYGTVVALVVPPDISGVSPFVVLHDDNEAVAAVAFGNDGDEFHWLQWYGFDGDTNDFGDETGTFAEFTEHWWIVVWRKDTGAVARMSAKNLNTGGSWVHDDLDFDGGNDLDWSAPGVSGSVRFRGFIPSEARFFGRMAARAVWSNSLPWSADSSGDAAIEAAGLETAVANWAAAGPSAGWLFNQESVDDEVVDFTGNGADQVSRTGTIVVTGDDPPGFDFALDEVVTAQITHGLALGHSLTADVTATAQIAHGLALGHSLTADLAQDVAAQVTHGLALGHSVNAVIRTDVAAQVTHGLALGHSVGVDIGPPAETELVPMVHRILTEDGLVGAGA